MRNKLLIICFIILTFSCGRKNCELKNYKKYIVKRIDMLNILKVTGVVQAQVGGEIKVGSRISGTVEKLFVSVGDYVKKGDLIAIIEHNDLQAKVNELKYEKKLILHEISTIKREYPLKIKAQSKLINSLRAQLMYLKGDYIRYKKLYKKDMVSYQDLQKKESDYKSLNERLKSEIAKLNLLKTEFKDSLRNNQIKLKTVEEKLKIAEINLGYAFIRAPISGVVSTVSTQEGETVAASLNAPVFVNIINLHKLEVIAYVDEVDIGKIKKGESVRFYVEGYPDKIFYGNVKKIYPKAFVKDNVVTFKVEISIIKGDYSILRPEMTAYIDIIVEKKKNVIAVPLNFVKVINGKNYVFMKEKNRVKKIPVKIGIVYKKFMEIKDGLKEGETIILPSKEYFKKCI